MLSVVQFSDIFTEIGSSDTGMALDIHEISQGQDYLLDLCGQLPGGGEAQYLGFANCRVQWLKDGNGECCSFTGTGLCLGNDISALYNWLNTSLLDSRGLLKTWNWQQNALENVSKT